MSGYTVERSIPQEFLDKIATGRFRIYGGVIRESSNGRIVGHLLFSDPSQLQSLGAPLSSLLNATMALSAMNLAVSMAGFIVVATKLDEINRKLDHISEKMDLFLNVQMRMKWEQEMERRGRLTANLKNLAIGLRTNNRHLIDMAFCHLTESMEIYREFSGHLLSSIKEAYKNPIEIRPLMEMVLCTSLVQAHVLALDGYPHGYPQEAIRLLDDLKEWHVARQKELEAPVHMDRKPMWLGRLSSEEKEKCRELVCWQRLVPEGLEYTRSQYQLCVDYGIFPDELGNLTQDAPLAILPESPRTKSL